MILYIDTNVLLDLLMQTREKHAQAQLIFTLAKRKALNAVMSAQSICDASYVYTQAGKNDTAVFNKAVEHLMTFVKISDVTEDDIRQACKSRMTDFEDAVQHSCAERNRCDAMVTSDRNMLKLSSVPAFTPEKLLEIIFHS